MIWWTNRNIYIVTKCSHNFVPTLIFYLKIKTNHIDKETFTEQKRKEVFRFRLERSHSHTSRREHLLSVEICNLQTSLWVKSMKIRHFKIPGGICIVGYSIIPHCYFKIFYVEITLFPSNNPRDHEI